MSDFTEAELELHFRAYKIALRIRAAMDAGDRQRATDELRSLMELVGSDEAERMQEAVGS